MRTATCYTDITPTHEVYLCGYVGKEREHSAIGVHDTPLAVSLLLEIEEALFLFVSIDTLAISEEKASALKKRIKQEVGIEENHIVLNAIHSHSLPYGFWKDELTGKDDVVYYEETCERIIEDIKELKKQLINVDAWIGTCSIHGFYSKRTDKTLPYDDHALILKFMNGETVVAAICNFNCHATVLGPQNLMISSDIMGAVRNRMKDNLGVFPLMITGASGDISNRQYRQGNNFTELQRVAEGISNVLKKIDTYERISFDHVIMKEYQHHVVYDNTVFFERYQNEIQHAEKILKNENASFDDKKLSITEKVILENKCKVKEIDFYVKGRVWKTDDITIVTFPGELASKFGLQLREQCCTKYFLLIGYADDYQGYFIEKEEYGKTYESKATDTPKGESELIVEKIGELL